MPWSVWQDVVAQNLQPSSAMCTAMLDACTRARVTGQGGGSDLQTAWWVWHWMLENGVAVSAVTCNSMLRVCANSRLPLHNGGSDVDGAWRVWDWMLDNKVDISRASCDNIIRACANGRLEVAAPRSRAWEAWERLGHSKAPLAPSTVAAMLDVCALPQARLDGGSDVSGAKEVWQTAQRKDITTSRAMCMAFLRVLARGKEATCGGGSDVAVAWKVWNMMAAAPEEAGYSADAAACTIMLQACAHARDPDQGGGSHSAHAHAAWEWMATNSVTPTADAIHAMIEVCANSKLEEHNGGPDGQGAMRVCRWALVRGMPLHAATAKLLLQVLASSGSSTDAWWVWGWMATTDMKRDERCCRLLLRACSNSRLACHNHGSDVNGALYLWKWLQRINRGFVPGSTTCLAMLQTCARGRLQSDAGGSHLPGAMEVWQWMVEQQPTPADERCCNAMLEVCAWCHAEHAGGGADVAMAQQVWDWMVEGKPGRPRPSANTCVLVLTACANAKASNHLQTVRAVWRWMVQHNVAPNEQVGVALLSALAAGGPLDAHLVELARRWLQAARVPASSGIEQAYREAGGAEPHAWADDTGSLCDLEAVKRDVLAAGMKAQLPSVH